MSRVGVGDPGVLFLIVKDVVEKRFESSWAAVSVMEMKKQPTAVANKQVNNRFIVLSFFLISFLCESE
jgi:hypothetical protein